MKVKFWGTRGSIATPGRRTEKYGGNTSCVEIRSDDGQVLICDAGTGLRELGQSLLREFKDKPIQAHLFVSHTHWDHIQGIPFFTPAFQEQNEFTLYGSASLEMALRGQMDRTYFPVPMSGMGARLGFVPTQPGSAFTLGNVKITTVALLHPGGAQAYRFDQDGQSVVYVTDNELAPHPSSDPLPTSTAELTGFLKGADLVIADTQYTQDEYPARKGWGHSIVDEVVQLVRRARVKKLALFHHDPSHSDEHMEHILERQAMHLEHEGAALECFIAREGLAVQL